jgi:cytochrome c553
MLKRFIAIGLLLASMAACGPVAEPTQSHIASPLAASCSGCHAASGGAITNLSDWTEAQLLVSLNTYRTDTDGTTVMHRLARGYSAGQIAEIAAILGAPIS